MADLRPFRIIAWLVLVWNFVLYGAVTVTGCGQAQKAVATIAPIVDPILRLAGFCQEHGAEVNQVKEIVDAYKSGDKVGALLKASIIVEELRQSGVEIPSDVGLDTVRALASIEGMQRGLRALSCRDPKSGAPVAGCQ